MSEETELFVEGEVLFEKGQYREAISKFDQILKRVKGTNNYTSVVNAHTQLGECYYHLENFKEAMSHFDKARALAEDQNDNQFLAISQVNHFLLETRKLREIEDTICLLSDQLSVMLQPQVSEKKTSLDE